MSARDHLKLGPDGKYVWENDPESDELQKQIQARAEAQLKAHAKAKSAAATDSGKKPHDASKAKHQSSPSGRSCEKAHPDKEGRQSSLKSASGPFDDDAAAQANNHLNLTTISSSMSGPGVGDDVAAKRASLLYADRKTQVGRRESPEPYDPRPTRMMYAKGILAGLIVVIVVVAIVIFLGLDYSIA